MDHLDLAVVFILSAVATWIAGVWLTRAVDAIDTRYHLGSAFGGLLLLGVATSLPEIAIVVSAAADHHYSIIIGTLLGGIALQTMLLSLLDARMQIKSPLTYSAASLILVLEATVVILVSAAAIVAIHTPAVLPGTYISLGSIFIFGLWLLGLWLAYRGQRSLPWKSKAMGATPGRGHIERHQVINHPSLRQASTLKIFSIFGLCAVAILIAGVKIQSTGNELAGVLGIGAGLFAATFIAFAAALPDFSTGIASIKIADYRLAMSDIFGGNSFLPALFLVGDLIAGQAVLQHATATDTWFAALGILLTGIYVIGLIVRPKRLYFNMGVDSLAVIVIYAAGIAALAITGG